jgi:hypothetical protein
MTSRGVARPRMTAGVLTRFIRVLRVAGLFSALLLWSNDALAEPIVITSGSTSVYWDGSLGPLTLVADGTHLIGEHHAFATSGFREGDTVTIRDFVSPQQNALRLFSQTVNGTFYPDVFLFGSLEFVAPPFVAPGAPQGTLRSFNTPFVMNGQLSGYADFQRTMALFSVMLTGSGTASTGPYLAITTDTGTAWLNRSGDGFTFVDASAAPIPEPASLLLLASGLVMAGTRRWRS